MPFNLSKYVSVPPYQIQIPDNFSILLNAIFYLSHFNFFLLSNPYAQIFETVHLSHWILRWKLALEFTAIYSVLDIYCQSPIMIVFIHLLHKFHIVSYTNYLIIHKTEDVKIKYINENFHAITTPPFFQYSF